MLERVFKLRENGTNVKREILAGLTTFATMSYIIVVNPIILSGAGMDADAVMVATCLGAALGTFLMAFLANYPIALAPAMGHNVLFVIIVSSMGIPWEVGLGCIAISGTVFIITSVFDFREKIIEAVPVTLRSAIAAGIGLLIALLGLEYGQIVVNHEHLLVSLGDLHSPVVLLTLGGLALTMVLMVWRLRAAILVGILATALVGLTLGITQYQGVVDTPPSILPTLFKLRLPIPALGQVTQYLVIIFIFFFLDLFDTVGTLIGVGERGGFMRGEKLPRAKQALLADAIATVGGACMGTTTVTSYIESTTGIESGGRTGLSNVCTGVLFLVALFFAPLVKLVGSSTVGGPVTVVPAIAPALIVVGALMMTAVRNIKWNDLTEAFPAFLTITLMAFTFSITEGISFGFVSYALLKLVSGRAREVHWLIYLFAGLFVVFYVFNPLMGTA